MIYNNNQNTPFSIYITNLEKQEQCLHQKVIYIVLIVVKNIIKG